MTTHFSQVLLAAKKIDFDRRCVVKTSVTIIVRSLEKKMLTSLSQGAHRDKLNTHCRDICFWEKRAIESVWYRKEKDV